MPLSLQELIERYRNGDDDVEDTTAVPKHASYGPRRTYASAGASDNTGHDGAEDEEDDNAMDGAVTFPIFIPSKGRYDVTRQGTCSLLARSRVPFTVVVEPQEASQYRSFLSHLENYDPMLHAVAVLPASHQGVSYARNHIARHLAAPTGWFWQMDDDIRCFSQSLGNKKNTPITPRTFFKAFAERMKKYPNATLFSAEYEMFAFNYGPGDVAINSYNNIAKLFKRECMPKVGESASYAPITIETSAAFDEAAVGQPAPSPLNFTAEDVYRFRVREDYDMVLRMIEKGHCAVRFRDLSFRVPGMSEASGGMTDYYVKQRADIREQNRMFMSAWPSVTREVLKGAGKELRFDIKVNWAALNPAKGDPAAVLAVRTADVDSLLISDADAAVASKLKEKDSLVANGEKKSSWKRGGRSGEPKAPRRSTTTRSRGAARKKRGGAGRKRRRGRNSDDDSDFTDEDDIADSEDESDFESEEEDDNAGDDSASDDDIDSLDEDDGISDEETYFALMESFYRPHKANKATKLASKTKNEETDKATATNKRGRKTKIEASAPAEEPTPKAKRVYVPKPRVSVEERAPTGWAGYALVRWRDVEPSAAAEAGLKHIDPVANPNLVSIGSTVAFVPLLYDVSPSVMTGTIISVHPLDDAVQIAPGRKYRGVALQTIKVGRLYNADCDVVGCAQKLDKLLNAPGDTVVHVTRSNVTSLMAEAQ